MNEPGSLNDARFRLLLARAFRRAGGGDGGLKRYYKAGRYIGWNIHTADRRTPANGSIQVIVCGWWIRFIWGLTFKPERLRWRRFNGHRLLAVRLWRFANPMDGRLVGIQWTRNSSRFTADGRRALA